ncbi:chaplin family protein [Streptomyces sp. NPDC026673]
MRAAPLRGAAHVQVPVHVPVHVQGHGSAVAAVHALTNPFRRPPSAR